jgi:hypothetical protein
MIASRPVVAATTACCGSRPVAKAFGASSSITYTFGIGVPVVIERFSTMRYSRGLSAFWISRAPLIASACRPEAKYWMSVYRPAPTTVAPVITSGSPPMKKVAT